MTNFEIITKSPMTLSDFIDMVVDDALEAEGCSLDLTMPTEEARQSPMFGLYGYREWLEQEAEYDTCSTSKGAIYG